MARWRSTVSGIKSRFSWSRLAASRRQRDNRPRAVEPAPHPSTFRQDFVKRMSHVKARATSGAVFRLSLIAACVSIYVAVSARPLAACTATPEGRPPETLADRVGRADVILEGIVTGVSSDPASQTASIQVLQYLKGGGPAEVAMSNFGSSAMCLAQVHVGDHFIFYATGDPAVGLRAYYSSAGQAVASPSDDRIAEIEALTGQSAVVLHSATDIALTQQVATYAAEFSLTETAAVQPVTLTPSPTPLPLPAGASTPTPFGPSPGIDQMSTETWATIMAASTAYPNDPAGQSVVMTQAFATLEAVYTAYASLPTPTPFPPPYSPVTPPAPVAVHALRLLGS